MFTSTDGKKPGSHTPIEKAPRSGGSDGFTADTNKRNFHIDGVIQKALDGKTIATQVAHLAPAGYTLTEVPSGFMLSRWGHSNHCLGLTTVKTLLKRIGVKS